MKTNIIAVIDRSGSMASISQEAVTGFDEFIEQQRRLPGEATLTTYLFDSIVRCIDSAVPLDSVKPLAGRYSVGGMTALNDAIGEALGFVPSPGSATIVVILTDGQENSSRKWSVGQVAQAIRARQDAGWNFVFLAANQDAFATARNYSIDERYVANFEYSGGGVAQAMSTISATTTAIRGTTY